LLLERKWVSKEEAKEMFPDNKEPIPLGDGDNPPAERIPTNWINVNGREQHEAMLRDPDKTLSLGLDLMFEKTVYLKRWGSWLNGSTKFSGEV
jgi:hypothetical protein